MPIKNKKIIFYAPPELVTLLDAESERTGAPIAELCRRAVRLLAFGEAQVARTVSTPPVKFGGVLSPVLLARIARAPNLEKI